MELTSPSKLESKIYSIIAYLLIGIGIFLRLDKYFMNRSFRGDEIALAQNVISRSMFDLLAKPLDGNQVAPLGFLFLTKLITSILGPSDYVFRLLPLIAGCMSVVLLFLLSKKIMGIYGTLFVTAGFALNSSLIIYASDFKQYSSDVLIATTLYLCMANYLSSESKGRLIVLGIAGFFSILSSHPAIFIASSFCFLLVIRYRNDRQKLIWSLVLSGIWAGLFVGLYFFSLRPVGTNSYLVQYWDDLNALMPMPPWEDLSWYPARIGYLFTTLLGLPPFAWFEVLLYLFGLVSMYLGKRWEWIFALVAPILFTILASGVINYPFKGRLIFFLIPCLLIVLGEGLERLYNLFEKNRWLSYIIFFPLTLFLLSSPVQSATAILTSSRYYPFDDDIKPVLEYIQRNSQPGDFIYVYYCAQAAFDYYDPLYGITKQNVIYGQDLGQHPEGFSAEFLTLPKKERIWFVMDHIQTDNLCVKDEMYVINYIERSGGQLLDEYHFGTASYAYLYILK